ncbi:hypothetical protein SAMN06264855_107121 [Halorubrum vacuolatum]|uniref:Uncharacterized protein n=2 Tax=Halorubrum vacuolatum TaxID=63740 RepID=A0A238WGL2_HALVU|nr:hypothetical protein SAMN06264855_107121 [Halorubrum vacuolatum]
MRTIILTGLAIVVPILITAYVIWFAVGIVQDMLQPIVEVLELAGIETLVTLFAMLVVFGVVAPSGRSHSIDTASGSSRRSIT